MASEVSVLRQRVLQLETSTSNSAKFERVLTRMVEMHRALQKLGPDLHLATETSWTGMSHAQIAELRSNLRDIQRGLTDRILPSIEELNNSIALNLVDIEHAKALISQLKKQLDDGETAQGMDESAIKTTAREISVLIDPLDAILAECCFRFIVDGTHSRSD